VNKEVKELWVEALRSGEIEQTTGHLGDSAGRCCLGVLCDLAVREGAIPAPIYHEDNDLFYWVGDLEALEEEGDWDIERNSEYGLLPHSVMYWAGLDSVNPHVAVPEDGEPDDSEFTESIGLSDLNDDRDWTFGMIADVIEDQL
jgi:hypothetical protein